MMLSLVALLALSTSPVSPTAPATTSVHGQYVEGRTATIFAGACHYGSQYATSGRAAVLGWSFASGSFEGVDLSGLSLAASVASDANLREGKSRRSVVYLPKAATPVQRRALFAWAEASLGDALGRIVGLVEADVEVALEADRYRVTVPGYAQLEGVLLPDRACCTMPYQVWYQPLFGVDASIVGESDRLLLTEKRLGQNLRREGENNAFVGTF